MTLTILMNFVYAVYVRVHIHTQYFISAIIMLCFIDNIASSYDLSGDRHNVVARDSHEIYYVISLPLYTSA